MLIGLALWLWATSAQAQVTLAGSDDLAAARTLYATGDYESALTRLATARTDATADEVDQYRALCLLALGRTTESEQSLRDLVDRRPHFRMSEEEVSPRLVAMFHAVRRQLLPGIVKALYAQAKRAYDEKRHGEASSSLRDLLDLMGDPDLADSTESLADLKVLAEGFQMLANHEVAAAKAAAEAAAASRPMPAETPPMSNAAPTIYSDQDTGVTPPVAVVRIVPPWRPTSAAMASMSYQGHLRIVVDEAGRVESATLVRPFLAGYDSQLVEAAKAWQFRPAMRAGVPVKFLRIFTIDVSAR